MQAAVHGGLTHIPNEGGKTTDHPNHPLQRVCNATSVRSIQSRELATNAGKFISCRIDLNNKD
jgi:hypothetical protein